MRLLRLLLIAAAICLVSPLSQFVAATDARPNVVLIMTDNHSPWTLGCYGNRDIRTPNIDRLAREGTLLTRSYSSNAVCSPTRATYLTGLMPSQHGVHCYLGAGGAQVGPEAYCTIGEFRTLPKILAEAGYVCGLSGKWHLGKNMEPQEGFTFWTTKPHGNTVEFYDQEIIEGGRIRIEPTYTTDYWTTRGIEFIEANQERPFFLFLAYNGPYGLGRMLLDPGRNRHVSYYADKELPSFPREQQHPWQFNNKEYLNNPVSMRRYAAEVSGIDDGVGRILNTLERLDLDQNTLVIFCADQGLSGGHSGLWGMGDHTRPISAFDSTMHVPLIYRFPGKIPAGVRSDLLLSNYDFLPTVLDYLNLKDKTPTQPKLPGHSYAGVLRGQRPEWEDVVFFEFETIRAIRTGEWKLILRHPDGPHELYHLTADAGERKNLFDAPEHTAVQQGLNKRLEKFFAEYVDPQYDVWRGGRSKANLISRRPVAKQ